MSLDILVLIDTVNKKSKNMDNLDPSSSEGNKPKNGWIPAAAAGIGLASQLIGQGRSKKQQKQANLFNLEQWNRTNEYNSPQAQMKRLQEAGLNPNLIYGSGSGSTGQAAAAPEFQKLSEVGYQPLQTGEALNTLQSFTDWEIKKAQTDNLQSQTTRNVQGAALDAVKTSNSMTEGARSKFELQKAKNLENISYQAAEANLKKTLADTQYTLNQDERATLETSKNLRESVFKIASMKLGMDQTKLLMRGTQFDNQVKQLDAYFASLDIRPTDPFYGRMVLQLLDKANKWLDNKNNPQPSDSWWKKFNPF